MDRRLQHREELDSSGGISEPAGRVARPMRRISPTKISRPCGTYPRPSLARERGSAAMSDHLARRTCSSPISPLRWVHQPLAAVTRQDEIPPAGSSFTKLAKTDDPTSEVEASTYDLGADSTTGRLMHWFPMIGFRRTLASFILPLSPELASRHVEFCSAGSCSQPREFPSHRSFHHPAIILRRTQ